jgi:tellurite methyltransferase
MKRTIAGYHTDNDGDWVGELSCGHNQHLRHRPPFQVRRWVLEPTGRAGHLGSAIDCPLCDRAEMPEGLTPLGTSAIWDEQTMPDGLRRSHRVAAGRWGLINVLEGRLRFRAQTSPPIQTTLQPGSNQPIPPEISHEVEALGHVRFEITWFSKSSVKTIVRDPAADRPI